MKAKGLQLVISLLAVCSLWSARGGILGGPLTNSANNHIYYLLTSNTWSGAESEAIALGGHLVAFNNANENEWVYTNFALFGGAERSLWIGLTDQKVPGRWEWVSGEPLSFTNWSFSQPNNNQQFGPQHWGMMWPPYDQPEPGKWNDYWNVSATIDQGVLNGIHGIVEVLPASTSPPPALTIVRAVEVGFPTISNQWYRIEYSLEIDTNSWCTLGPYVIGNGGIATVYDNTPVTSQRRFYRVTPVQQ